MILISDWRDLPQRREDDAYDRGYSPDASDFRPLPPVAEPDREKFTAEYVAEIEAAKEYARRMTPVASCARYDCRTSLTEDEAVRCPHELVFCRNCTWEEGCIECSVESAVEVRHCDGCGEDYDPQSESHVGHQGGVA